MRGSNWRTRVKWWALALGVLALALIWSGVMMFAMPGRSHEGPLPPLTEAQRELSATLEADVRVLAEEIGERNVYRPDRLERSAEWIAQRFEQLGYEVARQRYHVHESFVGDVESVNLEVEIVGRETPEEIVIFGAHYDSVLASPGANDNASGVAALLALAAAAAEAEVAPRRTLRFVAFVNEEPPFFQTPEMGSYVYAARSRERGERIVAMVSFDGIGYYDEQVGSQMYPLPWLGMLYPSEGDFIAVVGNLASRGLVRRVLGTFREHAAFPSQGAAVPAVVPQVDWSDHWAFWAHGYPGVMVTDTLSFRYPHYHAGSDVPNQLDFNRMARVVEGMKAVMRELAQMGGPSAGGHGAGGVRRK